MERLWNKDSALAHAKQRCWPEGIVISIVLVQQRHRKALAKCRLLVFDLEYRILVDLSRSERESIFICVEAITFITAAVAVRI